MNVAEFFALFGVKMDPKAEQQMNGGLQKVEKGLGTFADKATGLLGSAFTVFFAQDLYNIAKAGVDKLAGLVSPMEVFGRVASQAVDLDEIAKQARALGVTTEALQEYRFVSGQNGIEQKKFEMAMIRVNKVIGEAARGVKSYADVLRDMGLDELELSTMSSEERFDTFLGTLADIEDESKKTALGIRVLGDRTFPQFATLLKGGAEGVEALRKQANQLGFVVRDDEAQKAEAFNDALDRLQRTFGSLKNRALNALFEPLVGLMDAFTALTVENRVFLQLPFEVFGQIFIQVFNGMAMAARTLNRAVKALSGPIEAFIDRVGGMNNAMKLLIALSAGFFAVWAFQNQAMLITFVTRLGMMFTALGGRIALAATQAFLFMRTLSAGQVWAMISTGFTRLLALVTGTTAQMLLLVGFVAIVGLILEDIYKLFTGGESLIGEMLNIDPNSQDDLNMWYDMLLGIGVVLVGIMALLLGWPALIAAIALAVVYIFANWERVSEAFFEFYDDMVDGLADLMAEGIEWAEDLVDEIVEAFAYIVDVIKDKISEAFDEVASLPGKARGLLAKIPGASLVGLNGGQIAAEVAGGGAKNPAIDQATRVFQSRNQRSTTISPTIEVKVDATDRTQEEAADIFRGQVFDDLMRQIDTAYEGDEI